MPARITRFEDITAWQKARVLVRRVYECTRSREFAADCGLRNQIRRAAVSIMSNIAEGFERGGDAEFRQFLSTARGSAGEVRSQLYVALDVEYIAEEQFVELYAVAEECGKLIWGLMEYLGESDLRGSKYRK